jgi:hypothetical protein
MVKKLVALSLVATCLLATSSLAQASQWTCKAVRGNGAQHWVWTSGSKSYSWHKVRQMCRSSGARHCNVWCHRGSWAKAEPTNATTEHETA